MPSPERELQAAEAARLNRKALRKSEAEGRKALLLLLWALIESAKQNGLTAEQTAEQIRRAMVLWIVDLRRKARAAGRSRLVLEAAELGVELSLNLEQTSSVYDRWRAEQDAKSFAARWLKVAIAQRNLAAATAEPETLFVEDESEDVEQPDILGAATTATLGWLDRTIVTENSQAFTDERNLGKRDLPEEWFREWDAKEDAKVCPVCADLDGTIVRLHEPFPAGEPGDIHVHCRCSWTLRGSKIG